jgi:transposase
MREEQAREINELKKELAQLCERCTSLEEEKRDLEAKNESLEVEIKFLKSRVEELLRRIFGRRSERLIPGQLDLPAFDLAQEAIKEIDAEALAEESATDDETEPPKKKGHGRKPAARDLPRIREEVHPPPEDRVCRCCGEDMQRIGEETTEELEYIPAKVFVREIVRVKYGCRRCQEGVVIAPLPPRPIEKGRPGAGLLAYIAVSKFADHLPLYRQEQIFERHGLDLNRSTMCDWLGKIAHLLEPIVKEMKRQVLAAPVIQSDDTHVQVQTGEGTGSTRRGFLWVYGIPGGEVVYDFKLSRSRDGPRAFLGNYQGYLQTDGYGAYNALFVSGKIRRLGCMAHVRRKFRAAVDESPAEALAVIAVIQRLYRLERQAKQSGIRGEALINLRRQTALPLLENLERLFRHLTGKALPRSKLGRALNYALGQWENIKRYTEVAGAPIDNNSIENSMRPPVIGRTNWLFLGSADGGGLRASIFYSLIVSCRRLGVEPFAYLKDVIDRISTHPASRIAALTPRGWKETFAQSTQTTTSTLTV